MSKIDFLNVLKLALTVQIELFFCPLIHLFFYSIFLKSSKDGCFVGMRDGNDIIMPSPLYCFFLSQRCPRNSPQFPPSSLPFLMAQRHMGTDERQR